MDDDNDGREDCRDTDCVDPLNPLQSVLTCGLDCSLDSPCAIIQRDPAIVKFGELGRPDMLKIHGRFKLSSSIDPFAEGLSFLLANDLGDIYRATLQPGDLKADGKRYGFKDKTARETGIGTRDGLASVRLKTMMSGGEPYLVFYIIAYGDLSAATEAKMSTQVTIGNDMGYLETEWTEQVNGWKLYAKDYDYLTVSTSE